MHILDLPAVKASDKPHVNAASVAGPHDTRWTSIAPIYTCLGGNVGQIQLQRKLVHRANFPPVFPCPITSGLDMTGNSGRIKDTLIFQQNHNLGPFTIGAVPTDER
jgi:hypothetical protein